MAVNISDRQCEWPLRTAVDELTGWEVIAIQKEFKRDISQVVGVELVMATVWALENRRTEGSQAPVTWADIKSLTMRELNGYFPDEPAEPEAELGKDSQPGTTPPE